MGVQPCSPPPTAAAPPPPARAYAGDDAPGAGESRPLVLYAAASRLLERGETAHAAALLERAAAPGHGDPAAVAAASALERLYRANGAV